MKLRPLILFSILSASFSLSACVGTQGVVAFSPENDRVAIATNNNKLFTTDLNGNNPVTHNGGNQIYPLYNVSIDPFGDKLLFVKSESNILKICIETQTSPKCDIQLPSGAQFGGVLSFLPNGDFVVVTSSDTSGKLLQIYHPSGGSPASEDSGFDTFFIARDTYKVKGNRWYLKPYNIQSVHWVVTHGNNANLYTATSSSVSGPVSLPGQINSAVQEILSHRALSDIKSGILSPDGNKVAFRTEDKSANPKTYNLYVLDLSTANKPFERLVLGATFPIEFAFSPDSSQIVYESIEGGRSVWIANADGTGPIKLADNASTPNWWP